MKKFLLLLILLSAVFFIPSLRAQGLAEVGIAIGADNYLGDLGNQSPFPFSSTNPGVAITLRNFLKSPVNLRTLNRPLSLEARISWQRIGYDETSSIGSKSGTQLPNYLRGLNFRNDLFGGSANITYTFFQNRNLPLYRQGICFFVLAGAGVFYGKPMADLFRGGIIDIKDRYYFWTDGTVRDADQSTGHGNIIQRSGIYDVNLRDWYTEGQRAPGNTSEDNQKPPYSYTNVGFPIGIGARKGLTREITLSIEVDYYYFLTDYLDDVSNSYATYAEINANFPNDPTKQALARYISDPTGYGTNGTSGPATSPRGNPKKNDAYTFVTMEIAYKIALKKKTMCSQ